MKPTYAFESMKYGFFVHYIAPLAVYKDGSSPKTLDEAADGFDVPGFADAIEAMGVEYLIFTAWHYRAIPLYPSRVTEAWRPGCSVKRDLVGEVIDAVRSRGISVFLYTHPRDGHDFIGEERVACGWGEGDWEGHADTPNPETFDYARWNQYTQALYEELMERYGDRIDGIYTDSMGPGRFTFEYHYSAAYEHPIVDYLALRGIIKRANPDIALIQNGFGWLFSNDFTMPEGFFGFEVNHPVELWPACEKSLAMTPFSQWAASGHYGENVSRCSAEDLARFTLFEASCTTAGGVCWASGPYCGGGWDVGVMETMTELKCILHRIGEGLKNVVPSTSWPTISGDTLKSRGYVFECSSHDRVYEYIHIMRMPGDGVIKLPVPQDGALLSHPRVLTPGVVLSDFVQDESGVRFSLTGTFDPVDTVVRLRRTNNLNAPKWTWYNDSDKRFRYTPNDWTYECFGGEPGSPDQRVKTLGCFEYDARRAVRDGARVDGWFEGSVVEVYGTLDPEGGVADILIDDMRVATIDTRSPQRKTRVLHYVSPDLYGGCHTLSIVSRGQGGFEFDAIRVRE